MAEHNQFVRLYLLRHGESADNLAQRFGGGRDSRLTHLGLMQSNAACERLAKIPLGAVYTSPASRAHLLAELICAGRSFSPVVWSNLREASFGLWEGKTYAEVLASDPATCRIWMEKPLSAAPPEGESFLDCVARAKCVMADLTTVDAARPVTSTGTGMSIALVSHGGMLRALLTCLVGSEPALALHLTLDNGSTSIVDLYNGGTAVIRCLNDTSYLM